MAPLLSSFLFVVCQPTTSDSLASIWFSPLLGSLPADVMERLIWNLDDWTDGDPGHQCMVMQEVEEKGKGERVDSGR